MQERIVRLLEVIAAAGEPVSATDLASMTGVPRASIYRIVSNLAETGLVEMDGADGRFRIGMRLVKIALTGKADSLVIRAVAPVMRTAVKALGETAFFARYRGGRIEIVHVEVPMDIAASYIHPGHGRRPVHACSSAKAIAAFIHPSLRDELIDANPLRFNERTIIEPDRIRRELTQVQRCGYAICDGEIDEGIASVAVPVSVERLGALFSFGVVGPSHRIKNAIEDRILPVLQKEALQAGAAIRHCSTIEAESAHEEAFAVARAAPLHPH
jgi:DNA-binding IclR family transcriptional regulator